MQSFLIAAKDKNLTNSYMSDLLSKMQINALDINRETHEKAMGIEDVRNIQKAILLKPFRGKTKAVIIETYGGITPQAQNALLKILEEPPANTIIIVTTANKELMLPTIISRCKLIILQEKEIELTQDNLLKFHDDLDILLNGRIGEKLRIAEIVAKDKENAAVWLEKMSLFVRKKMATDHSNPRYPNVLRLIQKIYGDINNTNVSQRAALETLFLSF